MNDKFISCSTIQSKQTRPPLFFFTFIAEITTAGFVFTIVLTSPKSVDPINRLKIVYHFSYSPLHSALCILKYNRTEGKRSN
jgi:hypothetical protein